MAGNNANVARVEEERKSKGMKPLYKDWAFLLSAACAFAIILLAASCATRTPLPNGDTGNQATPQAQPTAEIEQYDSFYFAIAGYSVYRFIDKEAGVVRYHLSGGISCLPVGDTLLSMDE